jgi:uncharacterized membrane protein
MALLAASTKEEIPIAVGCLGIWYAVRSGRRLVGATIFAVGAALTFVDVLFVIPHYSPTGDTPFAGRYAAIGGTPSGMVHTLFSDPLAFVHATASVGKLVFVLLLLVPFLGLWALEPLLMLCAVPDLAVNLFSSEPLQTQIQGHYTAGILPFVVAAAVLGTAKLRRDPARVSFYLLAAVAFLMVVSPLVPAAADLAAARPPNARVAASQAIAGYLSERLFISVFPYTRGAHWIVVDTHDASYGDDAQFKRIVRKYESDKAWLTVFSSHGVVVIRERPTEGHMGDR